MSEHTTNTESKSSGLRLSLDAWAVIVAFLLAGIVRTGILKHVPW